MSQQQSLDALVQRIRASASALDPDHPPLGPPIGKWQQDLIHLRNCWQQPYVSDPQRPLMAELMAAGHDDAKCIDMAYCHLLGRAADTEGLVHYRSFTAKYGRLCMLVELASAEEAYRYRERCTVKLPPELARLLLWREYLARLPLLKGATLRLWFRLLVYLERHYAPRWARDAVPKQLMAELPTMADALLELSERQSHLSARQDHEYARQQVKVQQDDSSDLPEGYQAFMTACESALVSRQIDISRLRDDCIRARQVGNGAHDLGQIPPYWHTQLERWGFSASSSGGDPMSTLFSDILKELSLVSGFGLIGQQPLPQLYQLVGAVRHVLAPGGMFVLDMPTMVAPEAQGQHWQSPVVIEQLLMFHGFTELTWHDLHYTDNPATRKALVGFTSLGYP